MPFVQLEMLVTKACETCATRRIHTKNTVNKLSTSVCSRFLRIPFFLPLYLIINCNIDFDFLKWNDPGRKKIKEKLNNKAV